MHFLQVKKLNQTLGKKKILNNISVYINRGETVALLGPNGAGKTTLLRTTIGLIKAPKTSKCLNQITLENEIINNWPVHKRVESGLLYLPQQNSLFREMTVIQNLELTYEYHSYWIIQKNKNKNLWPIFKAEMDNWLTQTNLKKCSQQKAATLSGGQKRKLEVIRSLLMHPKGIMFDEPFAGVDPKSIYELKTIFKKMAQNNIAVLVSDHNVDQLLSIAQRVYVIIDGKVVTTGGIKDIINNDDTKEMYLGNQFFEEISKKFL